MSRRAKVDGSSASGCDRVREALAARGMPVFRLQSLLEVLYRHAAPGLGRSGLAFTAQASELAEILAMRATALSEGIGSLIQADGEAPAPAGNFRAGDEAAELLFVMADLFSLVAGLSMIGSKASDELRRLEDEGSS